MISTMRCFLFLVSLWLACIAVVDAQVAKRDHSRLSVKRKSRESIFEKTEDNGFWATTLLEVMDSLPPAPFPTFAPIPPVDPIPTPSISPTIRTPAPVFPPVATMTPTETPLAPLPMFYPDPTAQPTLVPSPATLAPVAPSASNATILMDRVYFTVLTDSLDNSTVISDTTLFVPIWDGDIGDAPNDVVCFTGEAFDLDAYVTSFLWGGPDCTATNGCGVHVHQGFDCTGSETQGKMRLKKRKLDEVMLYDSLAVAVLNSSI